MIRSVLFAGTNAETIVGADASVTVTVAALLATPAEPGTRTIARYSAPLSGAKSAGVVKVALAAFAVGIFVKPPAPSLRCHWYCNSDAGAPETVAPTLNVAVWPAEMFVLAGWFVTVTTAAGYPAKSP